MTRERAAELLSEVTVLDDPEMAEAHRVAISALQQQDHFREVTKKVEPMTNADRIRSMSDEELAELLFQVGYDNGWGMKEYALEWLQQPVEEDCHSICGATNLPCIRCNPGGCDNRKEGADNG